jgi:hypothetical protein
MSKEHKKIFIEIEVPISKYCWDGDTACRYLDNTGGHPVCELGLGFSPTRDGRTGFYLKDARCESSEEKEK